MGNNNLDTGHITVRDCHFYYSSDVAVKMRPGSSAFFKVENCVFIGCEQAVYTSCDLNVIRDCWITSSTKMKDKAVIENHGVMHVENLLGVPGVNNTDQRWIDNHSILRASGCRFGGEGAGFTPVVNFAKPSQWPTSVTLDQCYIYSLGNVKRACAVYLEEIPNTIRITDCTGFMGRTWLVMASPNIDLDEFRKEYESAVKGVNFSFIFWGNSYPGFKGGTGYAPPDGLLPFTDYLRRGQEYLKSHDVFGNQLRKKP
jgi:hypothetical protein